MDLMRNERKTLDTRPTLILRTPPLPPPTTTITIITIIILIIFYTKAMQYHSFISHFIAFFWVLKNVGESSARRGESDVTHKDVGNHSEESPHYHSKILTKLISVKEWTARRPKVGQRQKPI